MALSENLTWEYLKSLADALDSYRVRAFIDAKKEILNAGIYTESQYDEILSTMVKSELSKFLLFNYLKEYSSPSLEILTKFGKTQHIAFKNILSLLELLKYEHLIELDYLFESKSDISDERIKNSLRDIKIKVLDFNPRNTKTIYESVKVIYDSKNCSGCALCVGICPVNCLEVYNGFGSIDENKCIRCGLCYYFCPRSFLPNDLLNLFQSGEEKLVQNSTLGYYIEAYSAKTKIPEIAEKCQDGGIASTCLYYLFQENLIDIAFGAKMSNTLWRPEPFQINNREDVINSAGTKYVNNPTLRLYNQINSSNHRLAVVGVPCMMQALLKSKIYSINIPSLSQTIYNIGIFCMESFSYEAFTKICELLNVGIKDIKKTDINKGKFLVYTNSGEELAIPIKEVTHLARKDCDVCYDLTSESADISIGSIGSPSGWNTVLIRTEKGKQLFDGLRKANMVEIKEISEVKPGLPMLEKIALSKKSKCDTYIQEKKKNKMIVPKY